MASTSSSVTVTSPINTCRHKTDVETEEQLRTPDRRKSVDKKTYKKWLQMEIVCLSIIISIVLAVYFLPIIFFYKNLSSPEQGQPLPPMNSCVSAFSYTGDICREKLLSIKENFFLESQSSDILVLRNISISAVEQIAAISPGCKEVCMPFLCLYFSGGICDESGTHLIANRETCEEISNAACHMEFKEAGSGGLNIPDCSVLPEEQNVYPSILSGDPPSSLNCSTLNCRKDFFCDSDNVMCKPVCGSWSVYSSAVSTTIYAIKFIFAIIGSISAIAVFVITVLHFKEVFVFPSVFVIYENISISMHYIMLFFVGIIGNRALCSSRDFIESAVEPSLICIVIGFLVHYIVIQFHICWVLHATFLFLIVKFPYKFRSLKKSSKLKYIHIGCVIAVLVIPLVCALIPLVHATSNNSVKLEYTTISTIPLFCSPKNVKIVFYTSILPSLLLVECGIALLLMTMWLIHKNYGLFKVKHSMSKNPFKFGTPEKKLLIIFSYYIVHHVISYIYYILIIKNLKDGSTEFLKYITCESKGHDSEDSCDKSRLEELQQPALEALNIIFLYLIPVVNLVFVLNVQQALSFCLMLSKKVISSNRSNV